MAISKRGYYQTLMKSLSHSILLFALACGAKGPDPQSTEESPDQLTTELEQRKLKAKEYIKLCQDLKDAPVLLKTARGPAWLIDMPAASSWNHPLRLDNQAYPVSASKTLVCLFQSEKEIGVCNYSYLPGGISGPEAKAIRNETTSVITVLDLESKQKVAQTTIVRQPGDCPEKVSGTTVISGNAPNVDEIRDFVRQHWSP